MLNGKRSQLLPTVAVVHRGFEFCLGLVALLELATINLVLSSSLVRHGRYHLAHLQIGARVVLPEGELIDSLSHNIVVFGHVSIAQWDAAHAADSVNILLVNQARIVDKPVKDQAALGF